MCNFKKYFLALFLLFSHRATPHSLDTTLTGTIASRVITYTPTFGEYEYAKGFIEFTNGLTCTSDPTDYTGSKVPQIGINIPINGTINLSFGSMKLIEDCYLGDSTNFITSNHTGSTTNVRGCIFLNNKTLYLDSDITLTAGYLCIPRSGIIDGQGHSIYLNGGALVLGLYDYYHYYPPYPDQIQTITLKNLTIHGPQEFGNDVYPGWYELPNNFITQLAINLVFDNVNLISYESTPGLTIPCGTIDIFNNLQITGAGGGVTFRNLGDVTIHTSSRLYVGPGRELALWIGWARDLVFTDKSSELYLDNALLHPILLTANWTKGSIIINGICNFICDSAICTLGGTSASEDIDLLLLNGAKLNVLGTGGANKLIMKNYNRANYWFYNFDL